MARKPKRSSDLNRKPPRREPYDLVLIVCEGEKTEPRYFKDLRDYHELSTANIEVTPANGSDPVSIVKYAKKLQKAKIKKGEKFDKVYCVFDRDEHTNFDSASNELNKLKKSHFESARSWPCFEYWLLLHFDSSRSPFSRSNNKSPAQICQSKLKVSLPEYTKSMEGIYKELLPHIGDAIRNAEKAQEDALNTNEKNPSTEVHNLVVYLRGLKD